MAPLRQLGVALGFGMARLEVFVQGYDQPRGSKVPGEVLLKGGGAPQQIRSLQLDLYTFHNAAKRNQTRTLQQIILADRVEIRPREERRFPFAVHIPDDADLTLSGGLGDTAGCRIAVRAYIDWASDPRCSLKLNVTHHRECVALNTAMRRLGFTQRRAGIELTLKQPPPEQVDTHYNPPAGLADQLHDAALSVRVLGGKVTGSLNLNLREAGLADRLRALVVNQYQVCPFSFDPGELLTDDGKPDVDTARDRLHEILEQALLLPDNEKNRLLRASAAPDSDMLLRPSSGHDHTRPEGLLRPVDSPDA